MAVTRRKRVDLEDHGDWPHHETVCKPIHQGCELNEADERSDPSADAAIPSRD
jgi:hypothetical protein